MISILRNGLPMNIVDLFGYFSFNKRMYFLFQQNHGNITISIWENISHNIFHFLTLLQNEMLMNIDDWFYFFRFNQKNVAISPAFRILAISTFENTTHHDLHISTLLRNGLPMNIVDLFGHFSFN